VKLTIHLHLVPRLRICETIPSWHGIYLSTGTTLPFVNLYDPRCLWIMTQFGLCGINDTGTSK
jgi:hypothetical protein